MGYGQIHEQAAAFLECGGFLKRFSLTALDMIALAYHVNVFLSASYRRHLRHLATGASSIVLV